MRLDRSYLAALAVVFIGAAACGCVPGAASPAAPAATAAAAEPIVAARLADFDLLWGLVEESYPFFDEKQTDWDAVRAALRERVATATDDEAFLHALEATLDELYDPHCMLSTNSDASWRPVPFDVWPQWRGENAVLVGCRPNAPAARAGLRVGDEILTIDGRSPREAAQDRIPKHLRGPAPEAWDWALLSAVTGRHGATRAFTIRRGGETLEISVPPGSLDDGPTIVGRMLEDGRTAYIRIANFSDEESVAAFDAALADVKGSTGLVIDVRANTGGDTAIARPMMGRFIAERGPYATMRRRDHGEELGSPWTEYVDPRGPWRYDGPVVVLVDRFSVSMAEGFAMGMHGLGRARIVGTKMGGLGAAIGRVELPHLGASAQCSTEPVYHVDGSPRWQLRPDVEVDPLAAKAAGDAILDAGLAELRRMQTG